MNDCDAFMRTITKARVENHEQEQKITKANQGVKLRCFHENDCDDVS